MIRIMLANDRTEADVDALAAAFAISRDEVVQRITTGRIARWFELSRDRGKPHLILYSAAQGLRVEVNELGDVIAATQVAKQEPQPDETKA